MSVKGGIKLTKEQIKCICENIKNGVPKKYSIQNAGVAVSTFYYFIKEAEKLKERIEQKGEKKRYTRFEKMSLELLDSVKKAESEFIKRNLVVIAKATETTWQASAWLLERRYPEHFGKNDVLRLKGDIDIMKFDVSLTPAEQKKFRERMESFFKIKIGKKESFDDE